MEYIGECKYCGASCYYNNDTEKLIPHNPAPDCLCEVKVYIEDEKER